MSAQKGIQPPTVESCVIFGVKVKIKLDSFAAEIYIYAFAVQIVGNGFRRVEKTFFRNLLAVFIKGDKFNVAVIFP